MLRKRKNELKLQSTIMNFSVHMAFLFFFFFKVLSVFGGKTLYDKKSKLEDKMVEV